MFTLLNTLVSAALLTASSLTTTTLPDEHPVGASAFVTSTNQIRVSVKKPATERVVVLLKDADNHVLYQQQLVKGEEKSAILFTVNDLADGQYQIEVRSSETSIVKQVKLSTTVQQPVRQVVMN